MSNFTYQRKIAKNEKEAQNVLKSAKEEINREVERVKTDVKKDISGLVIDCASKVLEREINEQDHKKIIEEFLAS